MAIILYIGRSVYNWCRSTGLLDSVNPLSLGWYPRGKKHLLYNASNPNYLLSRRSAFDEWHLVSLVSRVACRVAKNGPEGVFQL